MVEYLDSSGRLKVAGPRPRLVLPWGLAAVSADVYGAWLDGTVFTAAVAMVMARSGCITGSSCSMNVTTATSGTMTARIRKNDVAIGALEHVFDSADGTGEFAKHATQPYGKTKFKAGDFITTHIEESGVMVGANVIGVIEIEWDSVL